MKNESPAIKCNYIPTKRYNEIVRCMPIVSVEALIVINDSLLFMRRNNEPAKGEWWFPGGRVRKGESFEEALYREVKEETGLEVDACRFINVYSRIFNKRHDITVAYLCKCKEGRITLNEEHSEYGIFKENPHGLNDFLVATVKDSKWKEF
jgi:colanic acid biosynthesis protein WcaH